MSRSDNASPSAFYLRTVIAYVLLVKAAVWLPEAAATLIRRRGRLPSSAAGTAGSLIRRRDRRLPSSAAGTGGCLIRRRDRRLPALIHRRDRPPAALWAAAIRRPRRTVHGFC